MSCSVPAAAYDLMTVCITLFMTFPPSLLHTDETCSLQRICRLSKVTINTLKYSVNYLALEI